MVIQKITLIRQALENLRSQNPANNTYKRDDTAFLEEISWIGEMGITTLSEHEAMERIGRSDTQGFQARKQKHFYAVYEEYKKLEKKRDIGMIGRILLKQFIVSCYQIKMRECTSI